jgi:hypothetical protein
MAFPIPEEPPVIKTTLLIVAFIGFYKNKKILPEGRLLCFKFKLKKKKSEQSPLKKWQRPTSQLLNHVPLLCSHPGESAGAGRVGLAGANIQSFIFLQALAA